MFSVLKKHLLKISLFNKWIKVLFNTRNVSKLSTKFNETEIKIIKYYYYVKVKFW